MSNAITDILKEAQSYIDDDEIQAKARSEALQALYEAVKGCAPPEQSTREGLDKLSKSDFHIVLSLRQGHNACRSEFLTNLSLLFGVTLADSSKQEEASDV